MADELVIADGSARDTQVDVQRDRLRVDARKWVLSKQLPWVYGGVGVAHEDGMKLVVVTTGVPEPVEDET